MENLTRSVASTFDVPRRAQVFLRHLVLLAIPLLLCTTALAAGGPEQGRAPEKIPFAVALWNLSGSAMDALIDEDRTVLDAIFTKVLVYSAHEVPQAMVVFAYTGLNDEGTLADFPEYSVKEVAQATHARLFVVAAENSATSVRGAVERKGPKVTTVFALDRKGNAFGRFFGELFADMLSGTPILSAWVKLAPQTPDADTWAPATILVAEGGNWQFPAYVESGALNAELMRAKARLPGEQCERASRCVRADMATERAVSDYVDEVIAKVKLGAGRLAKPSFDFPGRHALSVKVRLAMGGGLSRIAVTRPSGNVAIDRWVLNAFRFASESFEPLPVELLKEGIQSMEVYLKLDLEAGVIKKIAQIPAEQSTQQNDRRN